MAVPLLMMRVCVNAVILFSNYTYFNILFLEKIKYNICKNSIKIFWVAPILACRSLDGQQTIFYFRPTILSLCKTFKRRMVQKLNTKMYNYMDI